MDTVCAVMVTYNPGPVVANTIAAIRRQVGKLIIVDNASTVDRQEQLRGAKDALGFELIENEANLGIAEALNQGAQRAKSAGYPWVMLFDQDSEITEGYVERMLQTAECHPARNKIGSIHPRYLTPGTGESFDCLRMSDGSPFVSMTSGSLIPTWIFDRVGWFASEYFVDCVDWEFCARCRAAGFMVVESNTAFLLHAAGSPTRVKFLGSSYQASHHSAIRRYYIARNGIAFYRRYFFRFPVQVLRSAYSQLCGTVKCVVLEQDSGRKFLYSLLGIWDGMRGRMGKREGLS